MFRGIFPVALGAKDWSPSAFRRRTGLVYLPHNNSVWIRKKSRSAILPACKPSRSQCEDVHRPRRVTARSLLRGILLPQKSVGYQEKFPSGAVPWLRLVGWPSMAPWMAGSRQCMRAQARNTGGSKLARALSGSLSPCRCSGWCALLCLALLAPPPATLAHSRADNALYNLDDLELEPLGCGESDPGCLPLSTRRARLGPYCNAVRGPRRMNSVAFWGGWGTLGVALISPCMRLERYSSPHICSSMRYLCSLLRLSSFFPARPLPLFLRALPLSWRRQLGTLGKSLQASWRVLPHPLIAWGLHAAALWVWHIPRLFQATLTSELVHVSQHLSFF